MSSFALLWLLAVPGVFAARGRRAYYGGLLLMQAVALTAAVVWAIAPIALWQTIGHWWMLLWLIPTAVVVFAFAAASHAPGGG